MLECPAVTDTQTLRLCDCHLSTWADYNSRVKRKCQCLNDPGSYHTASRGNLSSFGEGAIQIYKAVRHWTRQRQKVVGRNRQG